MKITIDTKEDSKEDIKKLITLLNTLFDDIPETQVSEETQTAMFGMFDQEGNKKDDGEEKPESYDVSTY